MRGAIGLIGLNNTSPSTVFIAFYADGVAIPGCEKQVITQAANNDESRYEASCETAALVSGSNKITASFSGDNYNFPAITDPNQIPSPVLVHVVME